MILPWPLTTSAELAQVLRPGARLRSDSALRALREKGLTATPITVVPRSDRGARGRAVWYSSLMLDVARLVRAGDVATAGEIHAAAQKLAQHRAAGFVADWIARHRDDEPDPMEVDADTGGALTRLGLLTASARAKFADRLRVETFAGRVINASERVAFILDDEGRSLQIPTTGSSSMTRAESLVVVDTERLDSAATTIWVRPAFDPDADPNARVPGSARLLAAAEQQSLVRSAASAR